MTTKQKAGWKVLSRWGTRKSCMMSNTLQGKTYPKGRKVVPVKGYGPLCVFTKKCYALKFVVGYPDDRIKKCLYKPSKERRVWSNKDCVYLSFLPLGTALADSVTCLE